MANRRRFYQQQARDLIRNLRVDKDLTYSELARRLQAYGVQIETQSLTNKINRGTYSFTFALQVLAAMGVDKISIPQPPVDKPHRPKPVATLEPDEP